MFGSMLSNFYGDFFAGTEILFRLPIFPIIISNDSCEMITRSAIWYMYEHQEKTSRHIIWLINIACELWTIEFRYTKFRLDVMLQIKWTGFSYMLEYINNSCRGGGSHFTHVMKLYENAQANCIEWSSCQPLQMRVKG